MDRTAYRLADIVARFGGQVLGDADTRVQQIGTLEHAISGQIAFLANAKYRKQLEGSQASAVILSKADADIDRDTAHRLRQSLFVFRQAYPRS